MGAEDLGRDRRSDRRVAGAIGRPVRPLRPGRGEEAVMRIAIRAFIVLALVIAASGEAARGKVVVAPLRNDPPNVGVLFHPRDEVVEIVVVDDRPDRDFVAGAILGPGAERDKGIFIGYATETVDGLARFVETAATDAVGVLGMSTGPGYRLQITLREFVVDLYRLSGFSPMNCMGYGTIDTVLSDPAGAVVVERTFRPAFYEHRTPKGSMKEVATHALSRIYEQAAWQATVGTLLEYFAPDPDLDQVRLVLAGLGGYDKEVPERQAIFWLGISGIATPEVRDGLLDVFRSHEGQKVHQAAAEALGLLGIEEARAEIVEVLSGDVELGEWDLTDNEQVWYLVHALALLGETDLEAHVPDTDMRMRSTVEDLIRFHRTGATPQHGAVALEKLEKNREKLAKKRG
jgi:hypothetical protein